MTIKLSKSLIALIPIMLMLFSVPAIVGRIDGVVSLWVLLVCSLLYVIAMSLAGPLKDGLWAGYIFLPVSVVWLSLGLGPALFVAIVGTTVFIFIYLLTHSETFPFNHDSNAAIWIEGLSRIAIVGFGIIATHGLYTLLGGLIPLVDITLDALKAFASLLVGYGVIQLTGMWLTGLSLNALSSMRNLFLEVLMLSLPLILSAVLYQVGLGALVIIIGLALVQAIRYYQMSRFRQSMMQSIKEMSTLINLGKTIAAHLLPEDVLLNTYHEINKLVDLDTFYVASYDPKYDNITYPFVITNGQRQAWRQRRFATGITDYVIRHQEPLLINTHNMKTMDQRLPHWDMPTSPPVAFLGVPLIVGQKVLGALVVLHQSNPDSFDKADISLLQAIASQASLALRNANLYDRSVIMTEHLSLINQSLQDVMFNLDRESAMLKTCHIAMQVTSADKAAIFLLQTHPDSVLKAMQTVGFDQNTTTFSALSNPLVVPYSSQLFATGPLVVTDINETDDDMIRAHAALGHFRATLQVPLRSGKTVVGYLAVYHDRPNFYPETDVTLLGMLANQVTAALDNAELLQALELYASEQAQLVHLSRISSASLDLERIIIDVCDMMVQILSVEYVELGIHHDRGYGQLHIYTPDDHGQRVSRRDIGFDQLPEITHFLDLPDFAPVIIQHHQTQSDVLRQWLDQRNSLSMGFVPMQMRQELVGIIIFYSIEGREFTDNDNRLIEMATNQITAQIFNARVHSLTEEALVQRLEQLSLIEDIAQQISKALDINLIIESVLDAALQATQADLTTLALISDDQDHFDLISKYVLDGESHQAKHQIDRHQGIIGIVADTADMLLLDENTSHEAYVLPDYMVCRSSLAVPLLKGEKVIGVLNVESTKPHFFSSEHIGFIKSIAGHAAISIDNARMLNERQYRLNTLTYLRDLSLQTAASFHQRDVFHAILKTALDMLAGLHAVIFLYDQKTGELVIGGGLKRIQSGGESFQIDIYPTIPEQLIYDAISLGDVLYIPNMHTHNIYEISEQDAALDYQSVILIPIYRRDTSQQILCITFDARVMFDNRMAEAVDLLVVQAASHIENATLNEALRLSNNQMRAILDANRDGIILLDRAGRLREANRSAAEMLGVNLQSYINQPFYRIVRQSLGIAASDITNVATASIDKPEDKPDANYSNGDTLDNNAAHFSSMDMTQTSDIYTINPDARAFDEAYFDIHSETERDYTLTYGRDKPLHIKEIGVPVFDTDGHVIGRLLAMRDVTAERELAEGRKAIRRFVLHDLRNPLSSIVSAMHLFLALLEDPENLNLEYLNDSSETALHSAEKLLNIVEDALGETRNPDDTGEAPLKQIRIPLRAIGEEAYTVIAPSIREHNFTLIYQIDDDLPDLKVDPVAMQRVFTNLLDNAIKFTPPGGTLMIAADRNTQQENFVRVMVCDDGPGIPPDKRHTIFEPFQQLNDGAVHNGRRGNGIGLAYCKRTVEGHGGTIWVEPQGALPGACIAFTLPIAIDRERPVSS